MSSSGIPSELSRETKVCASPGLGGRVSPGAITFTGAACLRRHPLAVSRVDQKDWAMDEAIQAIPAAVATRPEGAR
jgi:hypothetical protein